MFGGYLKGNPTNELWSYDCIKNIWEEIPNLRTKIPCERAGHSAVTYKNFMFIFGGFSSEERLLNDIWKFDLDLRTWSLIEIEFSPNVS